jgi:exonuclease VII small subunit
VGEQVEVLPLDEAVVEFREAEEELETANGELEKVLKTLGWDWVGDGGNWNRATIVKTD